MTVLPEYFPEFMLLVTLRTGSRYAVKAVPSSLSVFQLHAWHPSGPIALPCGTRDRGTATNMLVFILQVVS